MCPLHTCACLTAQNTRACAKERCYGDVYPIPHGAQYLPLTRCRVPGSTGVPQQCLPVSVESEIQHQKLEQ